MKDKEHNSADELELDEQIGNKGYSKRQFLKLASFMGGGIIGFRKAVRKAFGKEPDGVPLVVTTDKQGNPDRVRYIPKERKRRLDLYYNFDIEGFKNKHPVVNGLSVEYGNNPTDLKLKFLLEKNTALTRRKLPNRIKNTPVTFEEDPKTDFTPLADRANDRFEVIKANINCGVKVGTNAYNRGTITATGYTDITNYGAVLTAGHVVENRTNQYLYHPFDGPDRGYSHDTSIGKLVQVDPLTSSDMDVAIYKFESSYYTLDPRATQSSDQPDTTGAWTFQGITDATDPVANDGPKGTFAGCHSTQRGCEAVRTRRGYNLLYEVNYYDDYGLQTGDSGGSFVDSNGKLLSHLSGTYYNDTIEGGKYVAAGGAGQELFDAVGFTLYP